jgi:hypothetical protein
LVISGAPVHAATTAQIDAARNKGLAWLFTHQGSDGSWRNVAGREIAATAFAVEALANAGVKNASYARGVSWLSNARAPSVDSLARQMSALQTSGIDLTPLLTKLTGWRNKDLGWGAYSQYETSFPDTSLALNTILNAALTYTDNDLKSGTCRILSSQKADGSWSPTYSLSTAVPPAGISTNAMLPTAVNVLEVNTVIVKKAFVSIPCPTTYTLSTVVNNGINWILAQKNADGGFGEGGVSNPFNTALAYQALIATRPADPATTGALDYLIAQQQSSDGGWSVDPLVTAFIVRLLPAPSPALVDTDGDGVPDGVEAEAIVGTNPNIADSGWLASGNGLSVLGLTAPIQLATQLIIGQSVNITLTASGGTPPYSWTLTLSQLPPGLTLSSTGTITGTPTTQGNYGFIYTTTDSAAQSTTTLGSLEIVPLSAAADGDLNGDGLVDSVDVLIGERILSGQLPMPTGAQMQHGDVAPLVNGVPAPNGVFDLADVLVIQRKALGQVNF